jgi:hypothetical protein
MLIDDNEVDNFINQKMIEAAQFAERVFVHTSSKSAIEFFRDLERITDLPPFLIPQFVFLDVNMPITDGFGFVDEFNRLSPEFSKNIQLIVLTSSTSPADERRFTALPNVKHYLSKPLTLEHLRMLESELV